MGAQILHTLGLPASSAIKTMPVAMRGLVQNNRFGEILRKVLDAKGADKVDLSKIDPRILALLQSGMPTSTIANQIAHTLAGKVATALAHGAKNVVNDLAKNKLVQAFASALAPPGGSPPGSSAEQAATLAQRLKQLIADVARAAEAEAGQQNRFPGQILDANPAKETPAQQQSESPASLDAMVSSFVESVLRDAVAKLEPSAGATEQPNIPTILVTPHGADPLNIAKAPLPATQVAAKPTPAQTSAQSTTPVQTGTPARSDASPGDILGRILARAINLDVRLNSTQGNAVKTADAATQTKLVAPATPANQTAPPVNAQASLESMVAAIVDAARNSGGNANGQPAGDNSGASSWNLAKNLLSQASDGKLLPQSSNGDSFATQANALLGNWTAVGSSAANSAATTAGLSPYTTVDANSIIDQVVKGMTVRNLGDNNSEVRMRLSPENLGEVSVKLSINGGTISASITAQHADVRDTLLANQNQLQKSLADAGLKLANFSVNVSSGGANGFAQQQQLAQQAGIRRVAFHIGNADEVQGDVQSATPTFGPPLVAGWNLGILNYLA